MAQILVRELDAKVVVRLKERARRNRRSLVAEVRMILEQAVPPDASATRALAARIRRGLAGRTHTDSAKLLAADRAR